MAHGTGSSPGEPAQMRELAARLRTEAKKIEIAGGHIMSAGTGVTFEGPAAPAFFERVRAAHGRAQDQSEALLRAALALSDGADRLEQERLRGGRL